MDGKIRGEDISKWRSRVIVSWRNFIVWPELPSYCVTPTCSYKLYYN